MKKSYFQKTYNTISNLIYPSFISLCLGLVIHLLRLFVLKMNISLLNSTLDLFQRRILVFEHIIIYFTTILLAIPLVLVSIELFSRLLTDNISNYIKSISQTRYLRQYLKQDEKTNPNLSLNTQYNSQKINHVIKNFNECTSNSIVDIRNHSISVLISYPKTQQAQLLLKNILSDLEEEISNKNSDYYFSSPNRIGDKLWISGTRR
ncbi:hypothetical protein [Streptococcus uberis]|uniref:hypothetical protein n=1 Tax=Streptococcus uberis TaxID=1349 RepID=UPI000DA402CB|nr:hypothetical protein [Streptococcus uberis]MCK1212751.1 hypothetical protein [Streptococcus uberis]SQG83893.1 membrane protein [Streptococcus uberis]